ncbi:MAG: DUF4476 domain-containing protein, partial [Brumimicrobium sp.]|nr:DUF4476 domain-containing protein [Brumimicrobium sp.]
MKTFLLSSFILFTSVLFSQGNNLVVFTQESKPFYVVVNGIRQNAEPETNVTVTNLPGEFYKVRVIFADQNLPVLEQGISFLEPREQISLEAAYKKGKFKLKFAGRTQAPSNPSTGQGTVVYHDQEITNTTATHNQVNTSVKETNKQSQGGKTETVQTQVQTQHSGEAGIEISINENGAKVTVKDPNVQTTTITETNIQEQNITQTNNSKYSYKFMDNGTMCSGPSVSSKQFLDFKYELENANMFTREDKVLNFFKTQCMTSDQVAGIIKIDYPTVDGKKIAKEGYRRTFDTENYQVVINALKNESDRQEVITFLDVKPGEWVSTVDSDHSVNTTVVVSENNPSQTSSQQQVNYSLIPSYSGYVNCNNGTLLNNTDQLVKIVRNASFADEKMNIIKQATKNKCLSVSDIQKLAEEFSFEADKMELFQWAFNHTYDIDNYYKLSSSFTHSSFKEELSAFIDAQPTDHFIYVYSTDNSDGSLIDAADLKKRMSDESFA